MSFFMLNKHIIHEYRYCIIRRCECIDKLVTSDTEYSTIADNNSCFMNTLDTL